MRKKNLDYMTEEDLSKITILHLQYNLSFKNIGSLCEVKDSGYWSRIMHGKKPVPGHVRDAMTKLFKLYGV